MRDSLESPNSPWISWLPVRAAFGSRAEHTTPYHRYLSIYAIATAFLVLVDGKVMPWKVDFMLFCTLRQPTGNISIYGCVLGD